MNHLHIIFQSSNFQGDLLVFKFQGGYFENLWEQETANQRYDTF